MIVAYSKTSEQSTLSLKNHYFRVIVNFMIKNILFAGKDFPAGEKFFSTAADSGVTALITKNSSDDSTYDNPQFLVWNRGSVVSSCSLAVQAENLTGSLDAACLIFDGPHVAPLYEDTKTTTMLEAVNDLILAYQLLSKALMDRFIQKKTGRLIFLLKTAPSLASINKKKSDTAQYQEPAGAAVCAAQSAFEAFSENFAYSFAEKEPQKTLLIKAVSETDQEITNFILGKLASEEDKGIQRQHIREPIRWLSVSGKEQGTLGFFKRL